MKLKLILKMSSLKIKDIREVLLKQTRRLNYLNGISSDPYFMIAANSACNCFCQQGSGSESENMQISGKRDWH